VGLLDRLAPRRSEPELPVTAPASIAEPVFSTKALRKFLTNLTSRASPVLLDLGPVVGGNVSFFGEQLGCKIFVEDIFADLDRHVREDKRDALAGFLKTRFPQADGSVDGILCWDIIDYMDRPAAQELANELTRVLRPDGALLARCATPNQEIGVDDVGSSEPAARSGSGWPKRTFRYFTLAPREQSLSISGKTPGSCAR